VAAVAGAAERLAVALPATAASPWLRRRPPRIAQAFAAAALLAHAALWGLEAPFGRAPVVGTIGIAAGLGWMVWAAWCFRRAGTTIRPTEVPTRFVDDGPFAYGRNPIYLGMVVVLLGFAVALGVPLLAAAAFGFAAVMQRVHIPHEEAALKRAFGGWYIDYAAQVRRWI
jgi:protein-S-isoprenylcysteine O-methyltransferase Ste14